MAINQIMTSKNPNIGAIFLFPLETKIKRMVPTLTSNIRDKNIRRGKITHVNQGDVIKVSIAKFFTKIQKQPTPYEKTTSLKSFFCTFDELNNSYGR